MLKEPAKQPSKKIKKSKKLKKSTKSAKSKNNHMQKPVIKAQQKQETKVT